jgi:bifunctional DNase/RNase
VQPFSTREAVVIMPERTKNMLQVTVADVVDPEQFGGAPGSVVFLLDKSGKRLLPIAIAPSEGTAIATNLLEFPSQRPMTFTLMANLLEAGGVELEDARVSELKDNVYIATVTIRVGETVREIDARPSDAITLALQMGRPIYVAESVMEEGGIYFLDQDAQPPGIDLPFLDQDALPQGTGLQQLQRDWDERMRATEEKKRSLADFSEEERHAKAEEEHAKYTEVWNKMLVFLFGTNPDQAVD